MSFFHKNPGVNQLDCMIDIETMDVEPTAVVLTIGACLFDPRTLSAEDDIKATGFYRTIDWKCTPERYGRTTSPQTIEWWQNQNAEAFAAINDMTDAVDLKQALWDLRLWVDAAPIRVNKVWAKDPDFDCVILKSACKATGQPFPFKFWNHRSVRTAQDLAFPDGELPALHSGVAHNALDDAVAQAMMIQACHQQLGLGVQTAPN